MKELEFYMLNKFLIINENKKLEEIFYNKMNNICCFINCWDMYKIVGNKRVRGVVD